MTVRPSGRARPAWLVATLAAAALLLAVGLVAVAARSMAGRGYG